MKDRLLHIGMAATLALSGCGPEQNPTPTRTPIVEPQVRSEVDLYYPELRSLLLYSSGELHTQKTTKWLNFTKRNFNPSIAQATFSFFEKLANTQRIIEYGIGDQSIPYLLNQRPRNQRVFFIIPENAPAPSWQDVAYEASTTGVFENGPYASMARVHNSKDSIPPSRAFTTVETSFNKTFSTEACQSSVQVSSVSPEAAALGQEIVCNSYGAAFTIKQIEVPYKYYRAWALDVKISRDPSSPSFPLYVLSEQEYGEIPLVDLVIR